MGIGAKIDWLGLEERIPDSQNIASVEISGLYTYPQDDGRYNSYTIRDSALIQDVLTVHQTILDHRIELEDLAGTYWDAKWPDFNLDEITDVTRLCLTYQLTNGNTFVRYYRIPLYASDLSDDTSLTSQLTALVNTCSLEHYELDQYTADQLFSISLTTDYYGSGTPATGESVDLDVSEDSDSTAAYDLDDWNYEEKVFSISDSDSPGLYQAILQDFDEGNLGIRYLFEKTEEAENNCLELNLELVFRVPEDDSSTSYYYPSVVINLQTSAEHTLAYIDQLGVLGDYVPKTMAEVSNIYD